jgi:hypothetical protein
LADAAAFRLRIDVQLDELAEKVEPSVSSPERLAEHRALVRRLVLAWLRNHPAVVALTGSVDEIAAFLFPAKVATGTKLAPKEG